MKYKLSLFSKALVLTSLSSILISGVVVAAETDTSFGIEVSSPIYEYSLDPGDTQQDIIKIKNVGGQAQTYYPIVTDFKAKDTSGAPEFLKQGELSPKFSLSKWISFTTEKITIQPGQSEAFNFNISIPADGEPGGHYGAILFSTEPISVGGTGSALVSQVGSLILVRVSGDAKESATIKSFSSDKESYDTADVKFTTTVTNSGNVHVQPKGVISIKNIFGGQVAAIDVNQLSANVLPGSDRIFESAWKDSSFKFGYYTATVNLTYGNPAQTMTSQASFWIVPWMTLLIALAILILVILVLYFGIKKYNSWIISKAQAK